MHVLDSNEFAVLELLAMKPLSFLCLTSLRGGWPTKDW
jgi:hypothetical protein